MWCSGAACRLPWSGVWIKGDRELNITQHSLGSLGSCRSKNNDQYLLSSSTKVVCSLFLKATAQCIFDSSMTLERCRYHFSGDTTMHTLFRSKFDFHFLSFVEKLVEFLVGRDHIHFSH
ncbi:hypothetical protein NECAME_14167 [Necator americanus]|uniref:Uncharacterized protein n=1 Tax=Necator americanus TaxID=51031 RepID=W2SPE8_NECAM|nr:hypothetical protein NECAME_14167 [Necator americanus]ETN71569.1 hypothetical protein NECAME_14167 [Necator americanus]